MKRVIFTACQLFIIAAMMAVPFSKTAMPGADSNVMVRMSDGTYVVNTTSLSRNVRGYAGPTPLKIHIKNDKVVKVEALRNQESPSYFNRLRKHLLNSWDGMKVSKAVKADVDAVTGATMSSRAVKTNVKIGLSYYKKNK